MRSKIRAEHAGCIINIGTHLPTRSPDRIRGEPGSQVTFIPWLTCVEETLGGLCTEPPGGVWRRWRNIRGE